LSLIGAKWEVWNVLYYATLVTTNQLVHDSKILRFEMLGLVKPWNLNLGIYEEHRRAVLFSWVLA
jgi:hypothetical protein